MNSNLTKVNEENSFYGNLYVVSTPIGNLKDITVRAIEVLKSVDIIACEDTRHSRRLCQAYDIRTPLKALHAHNENTHSQYFINQLIEGNDVALISDAGTPLISDPGYPLVHEAEINDIRIIPIPGCSAITCFLSVSGLAVTGFQFHAFLPAKTQQRKSLLESIKNFLYTSVFYESSHRIKKTLFDISQVLGTNRIVVIGRELTKQYETILKGSATELIEKIEQDKNQTKGEFVIGIQGQQIKKQQDSMRAIALLDHLRTILPPKKAAKIVALHYNTNAKELYEKLVKKQTY